MPRFASRLRAAVALLPAATFGTACSQADARYQAEDLASRVASVVCAESRQEREAGVLDLARAIDDYRSLSPYENRRLAIKAAVEEARGRECRAA